MKLTSLAALLITGVPALFAAQEPVTVHTVNPTSTTTARLYQIPGRTEPFEAARIFTRATGIIQQRTLDIGDQVKAGDVLAVVAAPEIDRAVEAARAVVEQAEVLAGNARLLASRSTSLVGAGATSQEEADQRTAGAAGADAAVRVARAELARLEEQQKFATVRAPFDAVIAARNFERGDRVRGDSATAEGWLYHLVRLDVLRFTVFATPDFALRLTANSTATVRFNEFPGQTYPAKVSRSSRVFDPTAGTMRVELLLENPDLTLPAGLTGSASFELTAAPNTFLVPTNTLITRAGQTALATVQDGKVAFLDVSAGRNLGTTVEVTASTLSPAIAVIINPNALLRAGDPVNLSAAPAPGH